MTGRVVGNPESEPTFRSTQESTTLRLYPGKDRGVDTDADTEQGPPGLPPVSAFWRSSGMHTERHVSCRRSSSIPSNEFV